MKKLNIGFIGCGRISDLHFKGYEAIEEASVYALCDSDPVLAEKRKSQWGAAKAYGDYRDLINDPEIDAVEILTPHLLHEKMVIEALEAGKHVAVQKPMTVDLASADRMNAAARKAGKVFKTTENYVFYPPIVRAKQMIDEGLIGEPTNIRIKLIAGKGGWEIPETAWEWRMEELTRNRGMQTFDHGHHLWSTAWYLMGDYDQVSAWIDTIEDMVDSPAAIMWKHKEGKRYGTCEFSYSNSLVIPSDYYSNDEWIEITGTEGIIKINRCTGKVDCGPVVSLFSRETWTHYDNIPCDWQLGFTGAAENFVRSILGQEKPALTGEEGRKILAMNLAVQKSAAKQRIVYLDELDSPFPSLRAMSRRIDKISSITKKQRRIKKDKGSADKYKALAPKADSLTKELTGRVNSGKMGDWEAEVALSLTGAGTGCGDYTLSFRNRSLEVKAGSLPDAPLLHLKAAPGVWAALLMGKKKMQVAFMQGQLKIEGNIEQSLFVKNILEL